jgi:hypothetical protein
LIVQNCCIGAFGHIMLAGHASPEPSQFTSHLHELVQITALHAGSVPVHVALHAPEPQFSVPQAALPPEQCVVHVPPEHVMLPHALLPAQVASQAPVPQVIEPHAALPLPPEQSAVHLPVVQLMLPHAALPTHVASQLPDVHCTAPQARSPVQLTLQFFVLHVMPRHAMSAVQSTLHDAAFVQLIVPHAPVVGHVMLQFHAVGQVTFPLPVPVIVQVVV